ncbi:hypothetical protein Neosp_013628 [[Neocosmospora] mangrovei]
MAQDSIRDIYSELEDNEIRVMHLWPGHGKGNIYVELSQAKLNDDLKFEALSWQWGKKGGKDDEFLIHIRNKHKNETDSPFRPCPVRPNLWWALKRIQKPEREVVLWADAICINQKEEADGENSEKSTQISMMTEIYGKAERVIVWLGEPEQGENTDITNTEVKQAVGYVEQLGNLDDLNHIASMHCGIFDKAGLHDLEPVFKLFRRGWFSRRWIVQEISVARKAILLCGEEKLSWEKFAHSVALLERVGRDGTINRMLKMRPGTRHVSNYAGNISALPAYRLVQNASELRQERRGVWRKERTLEQLVCFLAAFKASRSQDTIYAVLGLASDFEPVTGLNEAKCKDRESFVVDYTRTPLQVFGEFLKVVVAKSKSVDILCRPWAPFEQFCENDKVEKIELPSWIPSLDRKPYQPDQSGKMYRYNADPLVGAAIPRLKFFTASGSEPVEGVDFFNIDIGDENSPKITLKVFQVGTIQEIWDSAVFGNIPASWLRAAKWEDEDKLPPDEFWRTMVANRTNQGNHPEPWYPRAFHSAVREKGIRHGINTSQLIHEKDNAAYSEVFRRVQAVVWNRKLIKMKKEDKVNLSWCPLGLAPEGAKEGHKIYIALGCSVPIVISENSVSRKQPDQRNPSTEHTLIGECYVDGMMDGHAAKMAKWTDLTIV